MGNRTFVPIQSITLGSDTASVTFSDIPQTYRDLVCVIVAESTRVGAVRALLMRLGGASLDTGTNYSRTDLFGDGSSAFSGRESTTAYLSLTNIPGTTSTGIKPGVQVINFMSYANTSVFKTCLVEGAGDIRVNRRVGLWRSTDAISQIQFYPNADNIKTGSTFTLYGIGE